jgi:hypothetical protein
VRVENKDTKTKGNCKTKLVFVAKGEPRFLGDVTVKE